MRTRVENRLAQFRKSRGLGTSELARRVNVTRQTIYAIEAGTYVPNTEVVLHLARELEVGIDELMDAHKIQGYECVAYGHLAAAYCVASREADVCLATRSAAKTFGLDFIPLHSERYDLVILKRTADLAAVKSFLGVRHRATLRRKLEVLAGYDTSQTGAVIA